MTALLTKIFGANYATSVTAIGGVIFSALTFISGLSYDMGPLALIISPEWKPKITLMAGIAASILWIWNGIQQKSKAVTGGSVQQTMSGAVADPGTQTLVDATLKATKQSGEELTLKQEQIAKGL